MMTITQDQQKIKFNSIKSVTKMNYKNYKKTYKKKKKNNLMKTCKR